jgi:hypothetical protein
MTGTYSSSDMGRWKKSLDDEIRKSGVAIDEHDEKYLKELVRLSTDYASPVSDNTVGLQFFMIDGGAEGFLDSSYASRDPSHVKEPYNKTGWITFDDNDLLMAFDGKGKLISSSLLRRPLSIIYPGVSWTEATANNVYNAWDNRPVRLYQNLNFTVSYYGLAIDDSVGYYKGFAVDKKSGKKVVVEKVNIDLHKEEGTLGCIFIMDDSNPLYHFTNVTDQMLSHFEPQFIKDIQKAVGGNTGTNIGTMHMLSIRGWMPGA